MEFSKINWTDHTWNPWVGCRHVSAECDHCYADFLVTKRMGKDFGAIIGKAGIDATARDRRNFASAPKSGRIRLYGYRRNRPSCSCPTLNRFWASTVPSQITGSSPSSSTGLISSNCLTACCC